MAYSGSTAAILNEWLTQVLQRLSLAITVMC
jgi:hypothetical protein